MRLGKQFLGLLGALALLVGGLATACNDGDTDNDKNANFSSSIFPVTVTDLLDRAVTITAEPKRIVTTSPSALELLADVGGSAIARSSTATAIPGSNELTDIGPSYAPSFEQIIALEPDLVIADASAQAHLAEAFVGMLGETPILFVGARGYADLAASARLLGTALGTPEAGDTSAETFEAVANELGGDHGDAPRVLLLVAGRDGTLSAALRDSFVGDLVALLGAENVASSIQQSGPVPGYALLSPESIASFEPEVVLVITPGGGPSMVELLGRQLPELGAVRAGRVHEIDLEVFLQAPGPRARAGLRELDALVRPD